MGVTREGVPAAAVAGWKDGWFVLPHEVTWQDVDAMGHVNNAVYFQYFETARTKYWFVLNHTHEILDLDFIVVATGNDRSANNELLDPIEICVRISEMRNSSLDFVYEVRHATTGTVAATGKVVVVLCSWRERRKITIDDELRRKVSEFQDGG